MEELPEGYAVEFRASAKVFTGNSATSNDGKLDKNKLTTKSFKYEVVITETETGKEIKSERIDVSVQDFSKTVSKLDRIEIQKDGKKLNNNKVSVDDSLKLVAYGNTKSDAKDADIKALDTGLFEYSTSNAVIAEVDANGSIVLNGAVGKVKLTAKSGDYSKTVELEVVKVDREVSVKNSKISTKQIKDATGATFEFEVEVKDNFNEPITGITVEFKNDDVVTEVTTTPKKDDKGQEIDGVYVVKGTLTETVTKSPVKVEVTANDTLLGDVYVSIVEKGKKVSSTEIKVDSKQLDTQKTGDKATVTIVEKDKNGYTLKEVKADGKDEGFEGKLYKLEAKRNSTVLEIEDNTIKPLKAGKEVVNVIQVDGGLEDKIGTVEITVIDSTPKLASVEFNKIDKVTEKDKELQVKDLIKGFKLSGTGEYDEIKELIIETNGDVKVGDYDKVIGKVVVTPSAIAKFEDGKVVIVAEEDTKGKANITILDEDGNSVGNAVIEVEIGA